MTPKILVLASAACLLYLHGVYWTEFLSLTNNIFFLLTHSLVSFVYVLIALIVFLRRDDPAYDIFRLYMAIVFLFLMWFTWYWCKEEGQLRKAGISRPAFQMTP